MLRALPTAVAALSVLLLLAGPGLEGRSLAQEGSLEEAARELFADPDIQFELPGSGAAGSSGSEPWSTWRKSWTLAREADRSDLRRQLNSFAQLWAPLLWMLAAAGAGAMSAM